EPEEKFVYCPLGFDKNSFFQTDKEYYGEGITTIGIFGKCERRKNTVKTLKNILSLYGNNSKFRIHAHIYNPHLSKEFNQKMIDEATNNEKFVNFKVFPYYDSLSVLNEAMNCIDIVVD